jgi:hypothetical protein
MALTGGKAFQRRLQLVWDVEATHRVAQLPHAPQQAAQALHLLCHLVRVLCSSWVRANEALSICQDLLCLVQRHVLCLLCGAAMSAGLLAQGLRHGG